LVFSESKKEPHIWVANVRSIRNPEAVPFSQSNSRSTNNSKAQKQVKEIRILLADDHNVMRAGLKLLLEKQPGFKVVSEASDGYEAIENALASKPDVVVLDIAMPKLSGIEAAQRISAQLPQSAIIVLSMHSDEGYVLRALKAGAKGYLLKDSAESDLIGAIKVISEGKAFFSPEISRVLAEDYVREINIRGVEDSYDLLTQREREVLQLLVEGQSNKDIANLLNLSLYTVETHRRNLQSKLNLHSFPELILYAVRKGIIS
jgi:DNA-binding NarL/FixJ family response regulator